MCCGNCSVGENVLAKLEGCPVIIGKKTILIFGI